LGESKTIKDLPMRVEIINFSSERIVYKVLNSSENLQNFFNSETIWSTQKLPRLLHLKRSRNKPKPRQQSQVIFKIFSHLIITLSVSKKPSPKRLPSLPSPQKVVINTSPVMAIEIIESNIKKIKELLEVSEQGLSAVKNNLLFSMQREEILKRLEERKRQAVVSRISSNPTPRKYKRTNSIAQTIEEAKRITGRSTSLRRK